MTSDNNVQVPTIAIKGVSCKTDMGLYSNQYSDNTLSLLSFYGAPQQVKAIFSLLATGREAYVKDGDDTIKVIRNHNTSLRFRGYSMGYGKQFGLLWDEKIDEKCIIWTSPAERENALCAAFAKRKIPFDKSWLLNLETVLGKEGYFSPLRGWGGLGGYEVSWDDNAICDVIVSLLTKSVKRRSREKVAA